MANLPPPSDQSPRRERAPERIGPRIGPELRLTPGRWSGMNEEMPLRAGAPAMAVRAVLEAERLRLLTLCETLRHDLESLAEASLSSNADDEHDPEGATVAYERAQVASVLTQSRSRLDEVDRALQRYESDSYGICAQCGDPIPEQRLAARPTAQTCLRCAG